MKPTSMYEKEIYYYDKDIGIQHIIWYPKRIVCKLIKIKKYFQGLLYGNKFYKSLAYLICMNCLSICIKLMENEMISNTQEYSKKPKENPEISKNRI